MSATSQTKNKEDISQAQTEFLSVQLVLGRSWTFDKPGEDRERAQVGKTDPAKGLCQTLESRIEFSLVLTLFLSGKGAGDCQRITHGSPYGRGAR